MATVSPVQAFSGVAEKLTAVCALAVVQHSADIAAMVSMCPIVFIFLLCWFIIQHLAIKMPHVVFYLLIFVNNAAPC
jgi:hypothetical protein